MLDEQTIRWMENEARDDGDAAIERACRRALEGDEAAIATVKETLQTRVARAHREHCKRGHR